MRHLLGAFALASALIGPAIAAAEAPRSPSMQFTLHRAPASVCGTECQTFVFASGMIRADTPAEFEIFATQNDIRGAILVLESEGGSVLGAIALGRAIRRLDMETTVGRMIGAGGRTSISPRADCESMCAFVLLGGVSRAIPEEARVRVHQIWLGDRREDAVAATYSAEDLSLVQRDIGKLVQYTAEMGGGFELIDISLRIPPWEPMRALTRAELQRMRLDNSGQTEPTLVASSGAVAPAGLATRRMIAGRDRGWTLVETAGIKTLTRKHPLTVEGEEIGVFDITIACGAQPDEFTVVYSETRRGKPGPGAVNGVRQVQLRIGPKSESIPIQTSQWSGELAGVSTTARGAITGAFLRPFSELGSRSLSVTTASADSQITSIRVGNAGMTSHFRTFAASCGSMRAEATHAKLSR